MVGVVLTCATTAELSRCIPALISHRPMFKFLFHHSCFSSTNGGHHSFSWDDWVIVRAQCPYNFLSSLPPFRFINRSVCLCYYSWPGMFLAPWLMPAGATDRCSQNGAQCLRHRGDGVGEMHPGRSSWEVLVTSASAGVGVVEVKESRNLGSRPRHWLKWTPRVGQFYCRINCCSVM